MVEDFEIERQKQQLEFRHNVLKAEQQRLADVRGYTAEEVRKKLKERLKIGIERKKEAK